MITILCSQFEDESNYGNCTESNWDKTVVHIRSPGEIQSTDSQFRFRSEAWDFHRGYFPYVNELVVNFWLKPVDKWKTKTNVHYISVQKVCNEVWIELEWPLSSWPKEFPFAWRRFGANAPLKKNIYSPHLAASSVEGAQCKSVKEDNINVGTNDWLASMVRGKKCGTLHDFACHPCAGAMLIFSVSFQF